MQKVSDPFKDLKYGAGFGNHFETEAKQGAILKNQNNPLYVKYGLFAEQLSGTAFTVKRSENQKVWLYKVRPSVIEGQYKPSEKSYKIVKSYMQNDDLKTYLNQIRWKPVADIKQEEQKTFIEGLISIAGAGEPSLKQGAGIYVYSANKSMEKTSFSNSDGDFLIVPHKGTLFIKTLCGKMTVSPREICIIPRGMKFSIDLEENAKGWVAEVYGYHFALPQLGPIGANGLANPKDFLYPTAWYEDVQQQWTILNKYIGEIFQAKSSYSPYDVVGWKGNYAPCKYNLDLFNTLGSISFDHPDPCIFTVLTCRSNIENTAALDFVLFATRWLVADNTFKPPYFHRNCMSEYLGSICGGSDAKGPGFSDGCSTFQTVMAPHGPDADSYEGYMKSQQKPFKIPNTNMMFMFESGYLLKLSKYAVDELETDKQYVQSWERLKKIKFEDPSDN